MTNYWPPEWHGSRPVAHETKFGEIIGWRIWRARPGGYLQSYSAQRIWLPGQPMTGNPTTVNHAGVWAFKDEERAAKKAIDEGYGWVVGRVKLWGTVIEHDYGYRAENALIVSLDAVTMNDRGQTLREVRERYNVIPPPVVPVSTPHPKSTIPETLRVKRFHMDTAFARIMVAITAVVTSVFLGKLLSIGIEKLWH